METPQWMKDGELCRSCGVCCMETRLAPVRLPDIKRLMKGLHLTFQQVAEQFLWQNSGSAETVVRLHEGACVALDIKKGRVSCEVYEHRPEICRRFACHLLQDLRDYYAADGKVRGSNVFYNVPENKVKKTALDGVIFMRSMLTSAFRKPSWGAQPKPTKIDLEIDNCISQLVQIRPNVFPPRE